MLRRSQNFARGERLAESGEARLHWLRSTRQLDLMSPSLRNTTAALTQLLHTDREKAVALHDFVRSLPFGCVPDYSELTATDVLKQGFGDCFSKGLLFVAMLRCAQVPARLRFVSLPVEFLQGIVELDEPSIMHAMAEVLIDERWIVTDSYVPDPLLFAAASARLKAENRSLGYGIHVAGSQEWQGLRDASAQCVVSDLDSLPTIDWGVAHDPETFYSEPAHASLRRNFATRLKWRLGSKVVNLRVAALRVSLEFEPNANVKSCN